MPQLDEIGLKAQLRAGKFFRLYFIFGEESYLKQYYAGLIARKCVAPGMEGFNLKKLDASRGAGLDEVYEAAQTLPAFGGYRCVQAKDFQLDALTQTEKKELKTFVSELPDTTVLIFWQDTVEVDLKRNAKYRALAELFRGCGAVLCFDRLDRASLCRLLMSGAANRGFALDWDTALYLSDKVGNDLYTLQNELDKLCNACREGVVTRERIDEVCVSSLEASVFDLSRALLRGDGGRAFAVLEKLLADREKPELILGTLIAAYVDMYRAVVAREAGEKCDYPAKFFNYRGREFRLRYALRDAKGLSSEKICTALDRLNEADRRLKTRVTDERTILEKLLAELLTVDKL